MLHALAARWLSLATETTFRSFLLLAVTGVLLVVTRRASAALRHLILACALGGLLLLIEAGRLLLGGRLHGGRRLADHRATGIESGGGDGRRGPPREDQGLGNRTRGLSGRTPILLP